MLQKYGTKDLPMNFLDFKRFLFLCVLSTQILNADIVWLDESKERLNWYDAQKFCQDNNAILPSKDVFMQLWLRNNKASDIAGFESSVSYWTSSEKDIHAAYPFYFMEGRDTWYYKKDHYAVRCIKEK
jgi:hypothetical protein